MLFAHDTEVALRAAAALVNTEEQAGDRLSSVEDLDRFVAKWGWTGSRRRDAGELEQVRAMRPRLRGLWELDADGVVTEVNAILRHSHAMPQLVRHDEWDYHLHATPPDAPLANRMAVEAAMAFTDVIRSRQLERLRLCAADDCNNVHIDLSKNRSRRFCGTSCANRTNVAAYRTRQASLVTGTGGGTGRA